VDLTVVIAVLLKTEDLPGLPDGFNVFPRTCPDDSVLKPAVGTFDLPLGLRREGIAKLYPAFLKNLFPLWIDIIRHEIVLPPDRVPALDEAEDGVAVGVVGVRDPIAKDHVFQGLDMVPAGLPFDEVGMEEKPAVIVQARDQMPFDLGIGCPLMLGRIVLDELPHIVGQDLPVMGLPFGLGEIKIVLFGPFDDRWNRDLLAILIPEPVPDIAVVIGPERNLGGFNQAFLHPELLEDVLFNL
jgi:hypothetical protein